ncbi:dehydrogenase [Streptomyces iranensis]|uniref:Crotonyl-CoA carboxylase/reductase n=1 Tax=Streptomyces iranensis TaxID=576784 RepID=A0A060ZAM2_9ACTN|nr:crotonyl-CoA carboxylase/reductase [Streptomyces iranensis]MBP2068607.1 crotonyl-CoA carboxylase/reductase [Streptomyces iranensis]CDR01143.1 dehydrogenase [Streptomyces iranensis]
MTRTVYELGERPPMGVVPEQMYASVIRPSRYGPPEKAFQVERVDTPRVGRGQVLVMVMAAGINYNNVWSALGSPLDVVAMRGKRGDTTGFHIGGTEGSGIVWALGEDVRGVKVGDEIVISGVVWDEHAWDVRLGIDPMSSASQEVFGYETNYGSFAQFCVLEDYQCHPKPPDLTWEQAACYVLTGATAYRQLCGWEPHVVRPGDPVLIWGGSGGLGSMAIQIVRIRGGVPVAVVSSAERAEYCRKLGAAGVINRREFDHWGRLPDVTDAEASARWMQGVRGFGRKFWEIVGERRGPRIVLEHSGQDTIPTSMYVCDPGGMVALCGGTTGYNGDLDLRHLWMRQKRLQGSHCADLREAREVSALVNAGLLDPCLVPCGDLSDVGTTHQLMYENANPPGNMAVVVNAEPGSRN